MTNVYNISPDASDDDDFQPLNSAEYAPFKDLHTLLNRPAHLSIFLNYAIMQNKPNNLLFALCVHHYQRQEKLTKDIRKAANEIFTDFLNPSAVLRVSFPPAILNDISLGLHNNKEPRQLQNVYNGALQAATKLVNVMIKEFKNKLDMGLGDAYNVRALDGLTSFEEEKRVAKQILIDKFEELMKDTNDLNEEKNKALIAAVQYFLEDIGVLHGSSHIARSYSINKRDVEKVAKKLHSLRHKDANKASGNPTLHNPLSAGNKNRDPLAPVFLESDGSRENLSSAGDYNPHEKEDKVQEINTNRLQPHDTPVKRSKSLPKDHNVIPKRANGPSRPKSAIEEQEIFSNDLLKRPSSEDMHSSNSSDGSNMFLGMGDDPRRASSVTNLIEFEPDPDLDIIDDMILWSSENSLSIKSRNMNKKAIQRQDVIHEFIHTEQHYVRKLKVLNIIYYNPLQEHDIIEKVQVLWLFPNLDELIKIHKEFCNKLLKRANSQTPVEEVTDIIIAHLNRYDLKEACAKFCNHQKSALAMFKNTLLHSQELKNFVFQAEMHPVAKRLDLDQLIGCVLHRITKYPLLLNELKKCTKDETNRDFNKISEAIKLSKDLACFVNLRIRETENANRLERLQKSIDNQITEEMEKMGHLHNMRINAPHRKLMFDGPLTLMIDKVKSLELLALLMTDCIVLLQKQDARYLLKPLTDEMETTPPKSPVIMLQDLHITLTDKKEKRFYIVNRNMKSAELYELRTTNKDQKETWITSITLAIEQFSTGKLKHLSDQVFVHPHQGRLSSSGSLSKTDSEESSGESEAESEAESKTESETEDNNDSAVEDQLPTPTVTLPYSLSEHMDNSALKHLHPTEPKRLPDPSSSSPQPSTPRQVECTLDNLTELTSQDLILQAMNETRNIQRLCHSIGLDPQEDEFLKRQVQRATGTLNKNLKQLMTTVIADNNTLSSLEENNSESTKRVTRLEALLVKHRISSPK